jgi:amino acid adenylation domain-containing protein
VTRHVCPPNRSSDPGRGGLSSEPPPLPHVGAQADGPREPERERVEASLTVPLGSLHDSLERLAQEHSSTRLGVAAAIFTVLLYRHTQQGVLVLRVFDRCISEPSVQTGVLRVSLANEYVFGAVLEQVNAQILGFTTSDTDDVLSSTGNLGFGWDDAAQHSGPAPFCDGVDLLAAISVTNGDAVLCLRYAPGVYATQWMQEIADQFVILMRQVVANPALSLLQYSLVTERGRGTMPDPRRALETPPQRPLTDEILAWAARTPDAPAIRHAGLSFTYAELAECSLTVALQLRAHGVLPGDSVAVTGERSAALVGAMIGVFRSGAVLLTLDPKLPAQRRRSMLQQARGHVLVQVGAAGKDIDSTDPGLVVVQLDDHRAELVAPLPVASRTLPAIDPAQPAYVFFTSGSTGAPKGVKGTHAGLAHFLSWQRSEFGVGPGDRASQLTALSFDVVLRDMFLALTSGATLCIPGESDALDPARIFDWLERQEITTIHVVPSLARMWLNHVPAGVTLPRLRRIFFAGEPLTDVLVGRWRAAFRGPFDVVNLYGPTETTLAKFFYRVPRAPKTGVQSVGQALPQTQALIVNAARALCGLHEAGEIAIRTPFRTLGYIDNPQANAEAFVRNPFADDPDDLVYLTGDSGRYGADGLLEILGRIDNQVKIRGVRVEPGEIEACLARHPGVREAVVTARDDGSGEKMLVGYVVRKPEALQENPAAQLAEYRRFLRERLPESMVPGAFVLLDSIPLNPNGKVDKKALPSPGRDALVREAQAAPESELQGRIAHVWSSVLGIDPVGVDDNFFDLGGHSLLAVQLVRAVEQELKRSCPLPLLFKAPTVRSLCAALERGDAMEGAIVLPLQAHGAGPALFCICGVHLYQGLATRLAPDIPVFGIFLPAEQALFESGDSTATEAFPTLEAMAADYVKAMRLQQPKGPYMLAGVSFGGVLAYEMAQQLTRAGERVEFLALLDSLLPSAVRRDWIEWSSEQMRLILRHGPRPLLKKVHARLRRYLPYLRRNANDGARRMPDSNQVDRLAAVRQEVYSRATRNYAPSACSTPAVLVRALDTAFFKSDIADSTYGWGSLVDHLGIADVPGDHLGILKEPNVELLAQCLKPHLDRARRRAEVADSCNQRFDGDRTSSK